MALQNLIVLLSSTKINVIKHYNADPDPDRRIVGNKKQHHILYIFIGQTYSDCGVYLFQYIMYHQYEINTQNCMHLEYGYLVQTGFGNNNNMLQ